MSNTYRRIVLASRPTGRHHAMWSIAGEHGNHGLTGRLNYYRASGLHPGTGGDPAIGAEAYLQPWIVRVRVRVIRGMRAAALLASRLAGLAELCAELRITRIDGGSHQVIHEQPARVNALTAQALDQAC
jgi:epoxide hydrolase 4